MVRAAHRYWLTIRNGTGTVLHREEAGDWLPCYEDLLFSAVLAEKVPNDGRLPPASAEPVRRDRQVAGVVLSLTGFHKFYSVAVFADRVYQVLVSRELASDTGDGAEKFTWEVEAEEIRGAPGARRLAIALSRAPYPFLSRPLASFGADPGPQAEEPMGLYVSSAVMAEVREETSNSLDRERADILTGHLVREDSGRIALLVLGRIPAATGDASKAHVSFSPLTFQAAQKDLEGRPGHHCIAGWHHNHPPPCGRECMAVVPACKTATVFFSTADRAVHRSSFPAPYMVALVSGKEAHQRADQPVVRAWGWRDGVICERSFTVF